MSSLIAIFLVITTQLLISISCYRLEINNWNKVFYACVLVASWAIQNKLIEFLAIF